MFKSLTNRIKTLVNRPDAAGPVAVSVPALLIFGADYDQFTQHAVAWMRGVVSKLDLTQVAVVRKLHHNTLSKGDVRLALGNTDVPGRVEIFCGHGDYHALLGPPDSNAANVVIDGISHSVIYDTAMVPRMPGSLVAFSCRSARTLGRIYATFLNKGFIGFDDDLPLDFSPEFMQQLQEIFHSIVIDILAAGRVVPEHKGALEDLYDQAILFFLDGEGRKASKSYVFQLLLVEHRRCINLYSTYQP